MNSPSSSFSSARSLSPCSTRIFTEVWLSRTVVNTCCSLVGTVVFCSISLWKYPPTIMMPSECGVTSSSRMSLLSSVSAEPWIAAPSATTSSGWTPLHGSRPKNSATACWTRGMRVMPPTRITSSMSPLPISASSRVLAQISTVRSIRSAVSSSSLSRVSVVCRCSASLRPVEMMNGRLISVSRTLDSSHLAFSATSLRRCSAILSLREIDAGGASLEAEDQPVDDPAVEVLAAEERVAGGGDDLEHAVADLEDRDVEGAAAEVVDRDLALDVAAEAVRQRRRGGLVDDADDVEARRSGRRPWSPGAGCR